MPQDPLDAQQTRMGPNGPENFQPTTQAQDLFQYLGTNSGYPTMEAAQAADAQSGQGSWVPATFANANGVSPAKIIGILAAAGFLGDSAVGLLGAGGASGAAGGASAATGASGAAAGGGAAGLSAALPGTAVAGFGGAGAAGAGGAATGMGVAGTTLSALGKVSGILSGAASGAAKGRQTEAELALQSDALKQRQAEAERSNNIAAGDLQVTQAKTGQDLESQARRQAILGGLLQAGQPHYNAPANIAAHMGTTTGGGITGGADIGAQAQSAAMQRLTAGTDKSQFQAPPNVPTPGLTPQQGPSTLDQILSAAGLLTGVAGGVGSVMDPRDQLKKQIQPGVYS